MPSTPAHSEAEATRQHAVWPVFAVAILSLATVLVVQVNLFFVAITYCAALVGLGLRARIVNRSKSESPVRADRREATDRPR